MGQYEPARLSPLHRRQLMLLSEGASVTDVAKATNRSTSQVTHLKNSAKASRYLEGLVHQKEQGAIENSLVGLSVCRLRDILQDPSVKAETVLKAIENVLDREPTGTFSRNRGEVPAESKVFDSRAIEELKKDAARLGLSPVRRA